MNNRGFTLIELLVVMVVIAILAGLVLGVSGMIKRSAFDMDSRNRLANIESAIAQYAVGDQAVYQLQRWGLQDDFSWGTFRSVFRSLQSDLSVDITNAANINVRPPSIHLYWHNPGSTSLTEHSSTFANDRRLDKNILYGERTDKTAGGFRWRQFSTIGEDIDRTYEVMPKREWSNYLNTQFIARWPDLLETSSTSGSVVSYTQTGWPASDWPTYVYNPMVPSVIPRWEWPWGDRIFSRAYATLNDQRQSRDYGQLTPLFTIPILQAVGILAPDAAGATAYRTDRGRAQPWNDRWGNPLIVSAAVFIPPRYTFNRSDSAAPYQEDTTMLLGPRDLFLRKSKDAYGYNRAFYFGVGSAGPVLGLPLPSSWMAADDPVVLRALWGQISNNCSISSWNQDSFNSPPWTGVRIGSTGQQRSYVTTPNVIK